MKQPVDVEIMGQRLTVTSDEGDEHVRRIAGYVDEHMRQLARNGTAPTIHLALLTALNIASEYWKLQHEQQELHRTIDQLSQRVVACLATLSVPVGKEKRSQDADTFSAHDSGASPNSSLTAAAVLVAQIGHRRSDSGTRAARVGARRSLGD